MPMVPREFTTAGENRRMFDLTSSKLLILGIVALIVVGPKDLPILLRTIGKYLGMIRRQANEFKSQFDEAMRESELDSLKREVENVGRDVQQTMRDAETSVEREMRATESDINRSLSTDPLDTHTSNADGHQPNATPANGPTSPATPQAEALPLPPVAAAEKLVIETAKTGT